jgi:hypothetical protein
MSRRQHPTIQIITNDSSCKKLAPSIRPKAFPVCLGASIQRSRSSQTIHLAKSLRPVSAPKHFQYVSAPASNDPDHHKRFILQKACAQYPPQSISSMSRRQHPTIQIITNDSSCKKLAPSIRPKAFPVCLGASIQRSRSSQTIHLAKSLRPVSAPKHFQYVSAPASNDPDHHKRFILQKACAQYPPQSISSMSRRQHPTIQIITNDSSCKKLAPSIRPKAYPSQCLQEHPSIQVIPNALSSKKVATSTRPKAFPDRRLQEHPSIQENQNDSFGQKLSLGTLTKAFKSIRAPASINPSDLKRFILRKANAEYSSQTFSYQSVHQHPSIQVI